MYLKTENKSECFGCTACEQACPTKAISFFKDDCGFSYPQINSQLCINCNKCEKICPQNFIVKDRVPECYASFIKDKNERKNSTSGGIFFLIASLVIEQYNGIVYGAYMNENLQLEHIGVESISDLKKLRGSKYIQSNLNNCFTRIKTELKEGRYVFFTGTPCQVAGLYSFLGKDYNSLLTADLLCHGVPSQGLFDEHIRFCREKYHGDIMGYQFRDMQHGIAGESFDVLKNGHIHKHIFHPTYELSPYLYAFFHSLSLRESCYKCIYAKKIRVGDVTLGDFWGAREFFPTIDDSAGVSMLLLNSEKGRVFFSKIKENCNNYSADIDQATVHNGSLVSPPQRPESRNQLSTLLQRVGYKRLTKTLFRSPSHVSIWIKFNAKRFLLNK